MKIILVAIFTILLMLPASAEVWKTYKNQKYRFEIQYPDMCVLRSAENLSGTFCIALKDIASHNGIQGTMYPRATMDEIAKMTGIPTAAELSHGCVSHITKYHKITAVPLKIDC